ncbi:hypothetical protein BPP43_03995 [Brachyspira pilosicoli P43/6/78]|uniref:Uncharacterized protein n=1 Tax=Brachyspira pilosicoli P43/6/78 TaxID=1042417 RepID=A0A3B6VUG8_BRAPL|nr:hypothetical protein [Brachyspira pilosicoli]AGA66089.1 hypothetical protein BPP43_03995 [Brachyspira pilosicoli P43/6/78]
MIEAVIHHYDTDNEFRRINDIFGILKHQYKNIVIKYKKRKNKSKLFVTINNEKLDCNYSLEFYMQTVENILNEDSKMQLKERIYKALKETLTFNHLEFNVMMNEEEDKLLFIELSMHGRIVRINKGTTYQDISDNDDKVRKCLKDIYKEFEEEIQELFDME